LAVSFVNVAVIESVCEVVRPPRFGLTATLMFVEPVVMVIVAAAVFVPSAMDVAVRVTVAGLGAVAGALYVIPVVVAFVSVPQEVPLQPAPERDQLTPLFCESFWTVAVKFCVPPLTTLAVVGETATEIVAAVVKLIVATAFFVVSRLDVAVSVTLAGLGSEAGAVYVTEVVVTLLSVPQVAPLHAVPESAQVTP
jgi:hypothetical protein